MTQVITNEDPRDDGPKNTSWEVKLPLVVRTVRGGFQSFRFRRTVTVFTTTLLAIGLFWSLRQLRIDPASVDLRYVVPMLLVAVAGLVLNGVELVHCARMVAASMTLPSAVRVCAYGTLANMLPLPGSLVVRGAALVDAGARTGASVNIIGANAALRLAVASLLALAFLPPNAIVLGAVVLSGMACVAVFIYLSRHGHYGTAIAMSVCRVALQCLLVLLLWLSLQSVGVQIELANAAPYAVAPSLAAIVGIVPGGVGITEAIGALLALLIEASPAAAVLGLGLARLASLLTAALAVIVFTFIRKP